MNNIFGTAKHIGYDLWVNKVSISTNSHNLVSNYNSGEWKSFGENIGSLISEVIIGSKAA